MRSTMASRTRIAALIGRFETVGKVIRIGLQTS
jgi:hypothetical protein